MKALHWVIVSLILLQAYLIAALLNYWIPATVVIPLLFLNEVVRAILALYIFERKS